MKSNAKPLSRSATSGFTLLELLAAISILAILSALLFGAFNQASKAWLQAENRVETSQQARAAMELFTRELSQAVMVTNKTVKRNQLVLGDADSVSFVAPVSLGSPDAMVTYQRVATGDGLYTLNRTINTNGFTGAITKLGPDPFGTVVENLVEISFSNTVNGVTWNSSWPPNGQPLAVSLNMIIIDSRAAARHALADGIGKDAVKRSASQTFSIKVHLPSR